MNNTKVREMIKFSFYKNIQNKWFIIFNALTLLGIVAIVNWGNIVNLFHFNSTEEKFSVAVLDQSNIIYETFLNDLSGDEKYEITSITSNDYTAENIPDNFMIVEVSEHEEEAFQVSIISKEGININFYNPIVEELYKIRNSLLAEKYDLSDNTIEVLQHDLTVNRIMLSVEAEDSNTKEMVKLFSSALTYFITVFIFSKMANEIASEKQSKSTEYILTTVSEKEYLFAKIFSSIAVLILQGLFMIVYYFIAALLFNISKTVDMDFSLTSSMIATSVNQEIIYYIFALILYNVLNLILLCIIQATLASKTSSTSEAGNSASLLLFVMMAAYISTVYFLRPYEKVSILLYIISCIPVLSAYFVPGMMVIGQATILQIAISLMILIVSIPVTFHYCSKIFKNGILDYTKTNRKKKLMKSQEERKNEFLMRRQMRSFGFVIGVAIIIYVGTQSILSLVGNITLSSLWGNVLSETDITMILQVLLQVVSLGLASAFVSMYSKGEKEKVLTKKKPFQTKAKIVLIALFLVFVLQLVLSLLLYPLLGLDYDTTDLFKVDASSSLFSKAVLVITLAIIPAIFEELFFRKAIINFSLKYGKTFAFLFSALLFGMLHMNLSQGLFAFIMGLIFGAVYIHTGDIKLTMLVHFLNNGFAALSLILPEMGIIVVTAVMLIVVTLGLIFFIKMLTQKEKRAKLLAFAKIKVDLQSVKRKYQYIFTDYAFDVSLVLIVLMSAITEKILR